MKWIPGLILLLVFAPDAVFAQGGVRMSADFLPLTVGNRWVYAVTNEDGKKLGEADVSVQDHTIVSGRSFYALRGFPFVSEPNREIRVRYDRQERQFLQVYKEQETPLFLGDGASTDVLQTDAAGLPQKFVLRTDTMELIFQRGVGIVEGRLQTANGVQILKIASARLGEGSGGAGQASPAAAAAANLPPAPPKPPAAQQPVRPALTESVTAITESNPRVEVEAVPASEAHKLVLTVTNTSDKLLPFRFNSGQTYDFVITNAATGQEVWRWSRRMFFTQVIRSESLRAKAKWTFDEAVWNHRDNDGNPAPPGQYSLVGIVSSQPAVQSEPVIINLQ